MSIKSLTEKLFDKWPAKIVCFIIAVFLYFFHQASLVDTKTFVLPLKMQENGMVMHVGNVPRSISVVVRAHENDMKQVSVSDMTASVSLDTIIEKGTYELPITLKLSENLMRFDPFELKMKEDTIKVSVDKKTFKYVPILPSIIGDVAHGYEIQNVTVNPSTVEIYGPESVVNATEAIYTSRLNVSNAETNFATDVSYQNLNSLITVVDEGPFKATVSVAPMVMEREFDNVEVEIMYMSDNLQLQGEIPTVSIKLSGSMPILENYTLSKHAIQLSFYEINEPGTYEIPVRYSFPSHLQLIEKSDDVITVTVVPKIEKEIEEEVITEAVEL